MGVRRSYTLDYPNESMYSFLKKRAADYPDAVSYNYFGTKRSYTQFLQEIDRCAGAFAALGIGYKDIVSICMPNTPEAIVAFYALNKIGAIANMIHPLSSEDEMEYYFTLTKSTCVVAIDVAMSKINRIFERTNLTTCIVVSPKDSMPLLLKAGYYFTSGKKVHYKKDSNVIPWSRFLRMSKRIKEQQNRQTQFCGDDVAAILYSGGTTGYPKGIELTNRNFNALALQGIAACGCLEKGQTVLAIMPVFHGFGLGICIHTVQSFGGTSILLPRFQAKEFDKLLKKYRPNIIAGVPTLYEALLGNERMKHMDLSFLQCVISGGDSLSVSLKKKVDLFLKEHGADVQIREGYGLTECVTGSCLTPRFDYREGSIGLPYPDTFYKIVKPGTEEECLLGEEGEIVISGPTVMKGYYKEPEETSHALRKHTDGKVWLYTGDMGCMDADGFVYFKQRIKRIIISSGYSLYPQYIENVIDAHPDVLYSCVIGIAHPYKVQAVKAFLVLKDGKQADEATKESIKQYCQKHLAKYAWPYVYEYREELPKTLVGKVDYRKLEESVKARGV